MNKKGQYEGVYLFLALIVIVSIILLFGISIIKYDEYAFEYEFGKIKPELKEQGFRWIGIGTVKRLNNQYFNYDTVVDASTKDMQGVNFNINVNLRLKKEEAYNFLIYYKDIQTYINYLNNKVHEKAKTIFYQYNAEELLGKRLEIQKELLASLKNMEEIKYFEVKDVSISNIEYSGDFDKTLERKAQVMIEREIIEMQRENMELMNKNIELLNTDDYLKYQIAEKYKGESALYLGSGFISTTIN